MSARPMVAPASDWSFPRHNVWLLDNGMTVWAFNLPGQHVISAQLALDVPLTLEPRDREGVGSLALHVSDEGTLDHPGDQITRLLEACGASYAGSAGLDGTVASIEVPATRFETAMTLFAEIVARPAYAESDVARHVAMRLADIDYEHANPASLASRTLHQMLYSPDDRSSRPSGGEETTIVNLNSAAVAQFHARHWGMAGATLVLAGQLPERYRAVVEHTFGRLGTGVAATYSASTIESGVDQVIVVDRPQSVQAEIRIGLRGIDRRDPRWAAARLGTAVMGGSFGSRLNLELRERLGYTYGASMNLRARRNGGVFTMATSARTSVAANAVLTALDLLHREITDVELEHVRDYMVGVAALQYDTAEAIAAQAASLAIGGVGPEFIDTYYARLRSLTTPEVNDAYCELVATQPLTTIVVGDADTLVDELANLGLQARVIDVG